jgi:hypothetical protein
MCWADWEDSRCPLIVGLASLVTDSQMCWADWEDSRCPLLVGLVSLVTDEQMCWGDKQPPSGNHYPIEPPSGNHHSIAPPSGNHHSIAPPSGNHHSIEPTSFRKSSRRRTTLTARNWGVRLRLTTDIRNQAPGPAPPRPPCPLLQHTV